MSRPVFTECVRSKRCGPLGMSLDENGFRMTVPVTNRHEKATRLALSIQQLAALFKGSHIVRYPRRRHTDQTSLHHGPHHLKGLTGPAAPIPNPLVTFVFLECLFLWHSTYPPLTTDLEARGVVSLAGSRLGVERKRLFDKSKNWRSEGRSAPENGC